MNSKKICKAFFLCLYYGVFRYLPLSYSKPLGGGKFKASIVGLQAYL